MTIRGLLLAELPMALPDLGVVLHDDPMWFLEIPSPCERLGSCWIADDLDEAIVERMVVAYQSQHGVDLRSDPRGMEQLRVHAEQVAWLVDLLTSTPDGDGGSLMDNTLIVWGSELADGWHSYERYCTLILGGSWAFEGGRYLKYPFGSSPIDVLVPWGYARSGLPHQHLLVSVANAMGVEQDWIGLAEAETREGTRIDLRGGLPGLV